MYFKNSLKGATNNPLGVTNATSRVLQNNFIVWDYSDSLIEDGNKLDTTEDMYDYLYFICI